jgi:predicted Zn-dependent protease
MSTAPHDNRSLSHPWSYRVVAAVSLIAALGLVAAAAYHLTYPYLEREWKLKQANRYIETLEFDDAEQALQEILRSWPEHAEAHFTLGRTYRLMEKLSDAHLHLREAERFGWPKAQVDFEYLLLEVEENGRLTSETGEVVKPLLAVRSPEQALALQALAIAAFRANRLDRADKWLRAWAQAWPDDARAHFTIGCLLQRIGHTMAAQTEFETVAALQPESLLARRWLGIMQVRNGQNFAEAIEHLRPYLKKHPDTPDAEVALAEAELALNQPEAARATLTKLLERHPDDVGGLLTMAQLELDDDRPTAALEHLVRAENQPTGDFRYMAGRLSMRARIHALLGQVPEAEAVERRLKQLKNDLDALSAEWQALMKDSSNLDRHRNVGLLYLKLDQAMEASQYLDRVLQSNPEDQEVHRALADYFGKLPDAESQRRAAMHRQFLKGDSAP